MLQKVTTKDVRLEAYRPLLDARLYAELLDLGKQLKGTRVLHLNSTALRGGVAEILNSAIPLLRSLGIKAEWQVIKEVPEDFYQVTKKIHDGLQGEALNLSPGEWRIYEAFNRRLSKHMDGQAWDFVFIHDPQPAAALSFLKDKGTAKWLWRCHIDSSSPNPSYQQRFLDYLAPYDGALFTAPEFVFKDFKPPHLMISPVAIDPLNQRNAAMTLTQARRIVAGFGIDPKRPLVTHLSRFDPWKDQTASVKAWLLAKQHVPDLQLAVVGNYSLADPRSLAIFEHIKSMTKGQADAFVIPNQTNPLVTKAFLTASNVALHKSLREGFGLSVSEALWSKTPVIGGDVGGIRLQIEDSKNGYLVRSTEEYAKRIVELLKNPAKARAMGQAGHRLVRQKFLLPRLIRDELKFMTELG